MRYSTTFLSFVLSRVHSQGRKTNNSIDNLLPQLRRLLSYLLISDVSLEDLLFDWLKFSATYEISGEAGLRFTLESIYHNDENERF